MDINQPFQPYSSFPVLHDVKAFEPDTLLSLPVFLVACSCGAVCAPGMLIASHKSVSVGRSIVAFFA
jgi:hypothetical protein